MKQAWFGSLLVGFFAVSLWANPGPVNLDQAIGKLNSSDAAVVQGGISTLRGAGPAGLTAALNWYDAAPELTHIPVVEAIAGQRGAAISRLYWYTDLEQARSAAQREHKPILYLRMLGKLTDEYSCANSRFFRTVLYSNAEVSKILRERFVLAWVSERPVPLVTIDYGDGRVLKRTLTGNSIHYVLDPEGNVIDALPGLYGPRMFQAVIQQAAQVAVINRGITDSVRQQYLAREDDQILNVWQRYAAIPANRLKETEAGNGQRAGFQPPADAAMRRAISKSVIEAPLLRQVAPQFAVALEDSMNTADAATWERAAAAFASYSMLDASSIAVIRSENPAAYQDAESLKRTVEHFQKLIALDTVHNNFQYRRQILAWLRQSPEKMNVEEVNKRVYAELFLTPATDLWLGLMPEATYTALCDDGCVKR